MLALRYVYVLALVMWLGGIIVLGALVAPTTFQVLQANNPETGTALAGDVFGAIITRFHVVSYAAGGVLLLTLTTMGLLGPRPTGFAVRMAIIAVMLALVLYSGFFVLTELDTIQRAAGGHVSDLAAGDPRRIRFDVLHVLSERLMLGNMALALLLLYWEARER